MKTIFTWATGIFLLSFWAGVSLAGDLVCYGYTSTTSYFKCNYEPANSGNCTWWAAYKRPDLAAAGITGDADKWYVNAEKLGFDVGSEPKVGAVAVFSSPGHVAYVESVNGGSFGVSEMDAYGSRGFALGVNYATYYSDGGNKYHRNKGAASGWTLKGFIYEKKEGRQIASTPEAVYSAGSEGTVAWTGNPYCWNADQVWVEQRGMSLMFPSEDHQQSCETLRKAWNHPESVPDEPKSYLERLIQSFLRNISVTSRDDIAYSHSLGGLILTAQAAGITEDQYLHNAPQSAQARLYSDGRLELVGTENSSTVYGESDVQAPEGAPVFTGHPDHMSETDHDGKLPDIVVNDLWLRKKTSGSESHDHDFTVTDFYSDNVEWRVQAKNQGPGTKEKDKTVTVQVYLWKVQDDGDETKLEGVGKEEINKELDPGDTTTESKSPDDFRRLIKYPGEYFVTTALLTADSFKEEDKQNNFGGPYRFTVKNLSNLVVLSVSSSDGRASYAWKETASFHASFQLDGDRLPKKAKARVAWRLVGPSFPDGKIMETDRIKSSSLEDRRGNTHGENLEGVVLDFLPGDYELQAIVNPECTLAETDCSNNTGSFRFRIEEPEPVPPSPPPDSVPGTGTSTDTSGQPGGGSTDSGGGNGGTGTDTAPEALPAVCGTGADISASGSAGSVHIWNERHQLIFNDSISQLGFWSPLSDLDLASTDVCFNSDETGWETSSVACATPVPASGTWSVDLPATTPEADGTWTFAQAGKRHWVNPAAFGLTTVDGHVQYGGWRRSQAWVEQDASGRLALVVTFGYGGFSYPAGSDWHNRTVQAYWWAEQGTYPGLPGTVACDGATGQFTARFEGVELGRTGNVLLRLNNNTTDFAWNITSQWTLLPGVAFVEEPSGQRMRLDGVTSASASQSASPTVTGAETENAASDPIPSSQAQDSADQEREATVADDGTAPQQEFPTVEYDKSTKTISFTLLPGSEATAFPGWRNPSKGKPFFYVWKEPGRKMRKARGTASISENRTKFSFAVKPGTRGNIGIRYKGKILFADTDTLATSSGITKTVHVKTKQEGIALP